MSSAAHAVNELLTSEESYCKVPLPQPLNPKPQTLNSGAAGISAPSHSAPQLLNSSAHYALSTCCQPLTVTAAQPLSRSAPPLTRQGLHTMIEAYYKPLRC